VAGQTVGIGRTALEIPRRFEAVLLSHDPEDQRLLDFISNASDATVYHQPPYVRFAGRENFGGDTLFLRESGNELVAVPLYETARRRLSTGYSGALFPVAGGSAALRRGVSALAALSAANMNITFDVLQSAQSRAAGDLARTNLLATLLEANQLPGRSLWTRMKRLPAVEGSVPDARTTFSLDDADAPLLASHDGDARNQIRQAARHEVRLRVAIASDDETATAVYERFVPLHHASWSRTGLTPHPIEYWLALSRAVREGGGVDFAVFAEAPGRDTVAAVTCHVYRDRAIYWSGASLPVAHRLRANPFCLHGAMRVSASLGVTAFELGRFRPAERNDKERSITAYKRQFGGEVWAVPNVYRPTTLHRFTDFVRPTARRILKPKWRRA
jgi:hypothetical protein